LSNRVKVFANMEIAGTCRLLIQLQAVVHSAGQNSEARKVYSEKL
jgi:hypothetical protein